MANILDIFRTQAGHKLIERIRELTGQEKEKIESALTFCLPALLCITDKVRKTESEKNGDLISFIENADLLALGSDCMEYQFEKSKIEKLKNSGSLLEIPQKDFLKILKICTAFLNALITKIKESAEDIETVEIINTLTGKSLKHDRPFIKALVKKGDSPDLIHSSEEIALGENKKDDDESIIGGYAGGR